MAHRLLKLYKDHLLDDEENNDWFRRWCLVPFYFPYYFVLVFCEGRNDVCAIDGPNCFGVFLVFLLVLFFPIWLPFGLCCGFIGCVFHGIREGMEEEDEEFV